MQISVADSEFDKAVGDFVVFCSVWFVVICVLKQKEAEGSLFSLSDIAVTFITSLRSKC